MFPELGIICHLVFVLFNKVGRENYDTTVRAHALSGHSRQHGSAIGGVIFSLTLLQYLKNIGNFVSSFVVL